jgi:hypothetical protein
VVSGQWSVAGGQWPVVSGRCSPITDHRLSTIDYQPLTTEN